MDKSAVTSGVLGAADGVTSIAGVVAGGAAAGVSHSALAVTAIGGALAATVSMGGAQWLAESTPDLPAVLTMAAGTALGSGLPALPLLFVGGSLAWALVAVVALAMVAVVGETRYRVSPTSRMRCYGATAGVLGAGALAGWLAGSYL